MLGEDWCEHKCTYAEQDLIVDPNQFGQHQSAEPSSQVRATALNAPLIRQISNEDEVIADDLTAGVLSVSRSGALAGCCTR